MIWLSFYWKETWFTTQDAVRKLTRKFDMSYKNATRLFITNCNRSRWKPINTFFHCAWLWINEWWSSPKDALLLLSRITQVFVDCIMKPQSWQHAVCQLCVCQILIRKFFVRHCQNHTAVHIHIMIVICRYHDIHKNKQTNKNSYCIFKPRFFNKWGNKFS